MRKHVWLSLRGVDHSITVRQPVGCALVRYKVRQTQKDAFAARRTFSRWQEAHFVLHDFAVRDGNHAWHKAVREVQKVYPGTEAWLLSCSWAEGKWGRWVSYGGLYTPEYAAAHYIVGGWMQFKYPTFTGMYRHAFEDLTKRGFKLGKYVSGMEAWQSPLAQALAAGWARYTGEDDQHWSASFATGC